jgi:beta-glucosidase
MVADGVDVRTRPVQARAGVVYQPESGASGVRFTPLDADGTVLEERHSANATTVVGFDDGFAHHVKKVRLRTRLKLEGPVEVGTIGAGAWELRVGDHAERYRLETSGGFAEIIAPPTHTTSLNVRRGGVGRRC